MNKGTGIVDLAENNLEKWSHSISAWPGKGGKEFFYTPFRNNFNPNVNGYYMGKGIVVDIVDLAE